MWPLISSRRTSAAWRSASSGVSANCTPPAFIRPPVRTWDLMTVGPPMRWAICLASAASVVNPKSVTGMPARLTTSRASYSKSLMRAGNLLVGGRFRRPVEEEHLDDPGGPEHDLAVVRQDLAPDDLLDGAAELVRDRLLEAQPVLADECLLAVGDERLLVGQQPALQHGEHPVVVEVRLRALGTAAVELLLERDQRARHLEPLVPAARVGGH